jgi:hypothetical protein
VNLRRAQPVRNYFFLPWGMQESRLRLVCEALDSGMLKTRWVTGCMGEGWVTWGESLRLWLRQLYSLRRFQRCKEGVVKWGGSL